MKLFQYSLFIALMILTFSLHPQEDNANNDNLDNNDNQTNPDDKNTRGNLTGFQGIMWATNYESVKEEFRTLSSSPDVKDPVEIIRDIPEREILIRRNGIYYRYVFYKKTEENSNEENQKEENTPRFFFIESSFPFVPSDKIYEKLKEKYGEKTSSSVNKDNSGAYVWETEDGYIVQWLEPYNTEPYTRSIYYISKKIRTEIEKDLEEYQNYRELKAVKNLLP